ncbi:MAG: hypothetical protein ACLQVK_00450 [Acidimicrobiales bacterium]|jgi:hypothetical protein
MGRRVPGAGLYRVGAGYHAVTRRTRLFVPAVAKAGADVVRQELSG